MRNLSRAKAGQIESRQFGGSHAQRDVFQRTLLEAALRSGRYDLARSLVAERLALRPTSTYAARQQQRLVTAA